MVALGLLLPAYEWLSLPQIQCLWKESQPRYSTYMGKTINTVFDLTTQRWSSTTHVRRLSGSDTLLTH